jgi:hypothetical protein
MDDVIVLPKDRSKMAYDVSKITLTPGDKQEKRHLVSPLVYRFDTRGAIGAGVNLRIKGGFRIEASPDGTRWFTRLDTWSQGVSDQSVDLSVLTGSHDELIKIIQFTGSDSRYLQVRGQSTVEREHCRYVAPGGSFVYRLDLPDVVECHIELLMGNGYHVQCSSDGKTWSDGLDADHPKVQQNADAGWLRMLDISPYLKRSRMLYLRFSDLGKPDAYGGRLAFLRRLTAYGVFNSGRVFVKLSDTTEGHGQPLSLDRLVFRTWKRPASH